MKGNISEPFYLTEISEGKIWIITAKIVIFLIRFRILELSSDRNYEFFLSLLDQTNYLKLYLFGVRTDCSSLSSIVHTGDVPTEWYWFPRISPLCVVITMEFTPRRLFSLLRTHLFWEGLTSEFYRSFVYLNLNSLNSLFRLRCVLFWYGLCLFD